MKVTVKLNTANINLIEKAISRNLVKTADALKTDLQQAETMPFKTGQLQNRSTFIDDKESATGKVYIVSDTPYARRLYFHPEYNFNRAENKAAGGAWFEPYISGQKKDYAKRVFAKFMQRSCGG